MNFARLNHILIPTTKEERDHLRNTRFARVFVQPLARTWLALTDEGRGLLALSLLASLVGLDVIHGQNHLLWAASFSLLVASLAVRPLFRLRGVRVDVEGPPRVSVGGVARFRVTLSNDEERSHRDLRLSLPFLPWDGSWLPGKTRLAELPPRGRSSLEVAARFVARGHHHIDAFAAAALAPLGLAVGPPVHSRGTRFVVVPRIVPIASLDVGGRPRHQQGGVALASQRGESMELIGLRPYRRGDRIRDLHAKTWARLGTPVVREYQQEYFSRVAVVLDCDGRSSQEDQLEAAISLTAGVIRHLARTDALIDLLVAGSGHAPLTIGRSVGAFEQALDELADVRPATPFEPDACFEAVRPLLARASALIFVALALDEPRRAWLARVREVGVASRTLVVARASDSTREAERAGVRWLEAAMLVRACERGEAISL